MCGLHPPFVLAGLDGLHCLKVLNLSSNEIQCIEGLTGLQQLKKLILSYNNINTLEGMTQLHGLHHQLEYLDLTGERTPGPGHRIGGIWGSIVHRRKLNGRLRPSVPELLDLGCLLHVTLTFRASHFSTHPPSPGARIRGMPRRTLLLLRAVWETCLLVEYCSSYIVALKTEAHVTRMEIVVAC